MNAGRTVFAQLIAHLSPIEFQKCVTRYDGDQHHRSLSCWDQYLAMGFAQFTYRESLRDIEACLGSMSGKLYHMDSVVGLPARHWRTPMKLTTGASSPISRSTWSALPDRFHAEDPIGVDLDHSLYALDSTTIDLCLSLFPWAKFRQHKGAVKMHTLLDLHGNIPAFIRITCGKVYDVNILDQILARGRRVLT